MTTRFGILDTTILSASACAICAMRLLVVRWPIGRIDGLAIASLFADSEIDVEVG
jgi:hypothetical protein